VVALARNPNESGDANLETRLYPLQNWRADINLDGGTTGADIEAFFAAFEIANVGPSQGVGAYSGVLTGYAGYVRDRFAAGGDLYHVRHRVYDTRMGRWITRDPLGYVDGMGLYEYVRSAPMVNSDPDGRQGQNAGLFAGVEFKSCDSLQMLEILNMLQDLYEQMRILDEDIERAREIIRRRRDDQHANMFRRLFHDDFMPGWVFTCMQGCIEQIRQFLRKPLVIDCTPRSLCLTSEDNPSAVWVEPLLGENYMTLCAAFWTIPKKAAIKTLFHELSHAACDTEDLIGVFEGEPINMCKDAYIYEEFLFASAESIAGRVRATVDMCELQRDRKKRR
jgi:RHS repeat-associated protein